MITVSSNNNYIFSISDTVISDRHHETVSQKDLDDSPVPILQEEDLIGFPEQGQ